MKKLRVFSFILVLILITSFGEKYIGTNDAFAEEESATISSPAKRIQNHGYPRLANQLQGCCGFRKLPLLDDLFYYDLAIGDPDLVLALPEYLGKNGTLRSKNPNLVFLIYFSAGDVNPYYNQPIQIAFRDSFQNSWYLRDVNKKQVPLYGSGDHWTLAQNPSTPVNQFMPQFLDEKVLQTGLVDGIFYDWAMTYISWINHRKDVNGPVDIDNDGKEDSDEKIDKIWTRGFLKMLQNSRKQFSPGMLIMGNGGWNTGPAYSKALNGVMIEQFLEGEKDQKLYGWRAIMRTYTYYQKKSPQPRLSLIMANDDNEENFRLMRLALSSALMHDGYFCFTNRKGAYQSDRWYDEYSVDLNTGKAEKKLEYKGYLGKPLSKAYEASNPKRFLDKAVENASSHAEKSVWRRDFENGIVLVNPDETEKKVDLKGTFRKIRGSVDPKFNDGASMSTIILGGKEGVILLKSRN
jgi:hypothetical protein